MAFQSPTILPSGTTFAQLQAGGLRGQLQRMATVNNFSSAIRSMLLGSPSDLYTGIVHTVDSFLRGDPIATSDINARLLNQVTALKAMEAALEEVAVLVSANPGSLSFIATTAASGHQQRRHFP